MTTCETNSVLAVIAKLLKTQDETPLILATKMPESWSIAITYHLYKGRWSGVATDNIQDIAHHGFSGHDFMKQDTIAVLYRTKQADYLVINQDILDDATAVARES